MLRSLRTPRAKSRPLRPLPNLSHTAGRGGSAKGAVGWGAPRRPCTCDRTEEQRGLAARPASLLANVTRAHTTDAWRRAPQRLMLRSSRMRWGLGFYASSPEPGFLGAPWCAPRRVLDAGLLRTESAARARSRSSPGTAEAPHPRGPFATAQSRLTHQRGRSLLHPGGTAWRASKQRWERVVKIHIILKNESNFLKSTLVRAAVQKGLEPLEPLDGVGSVLAKPSKSKPFHSTQFLGQPPNSPRASDMRLRGEALLESTPRQIPPLE